MDFTQNSRLGRRDFLKLGTTTAALVAMDALTPKLAFGDDPPRGKRPNILFVFSDEHRWCSLPFTEMPQVIAPNMARLAHEGTRFDNCCSTSPICIPYRGMLMTGQWPHQSQCISNDCFENGDVIGVTSPTIAQTFKKAGYATGYVGKWHLRNETAKNAGFDYFQHWLYGDNHWETPVRDESTGEDFKPVKGYNAIGMTDQALDFIRTQAKGDKPWLMMLSINPPHWQWDDAPEEFVKLYPQDKLAFRPNVTEDRYKKGQELLHYQHYHAHITAVDRELGRLMDELKKLGLEQDTILIYTSDHGSSFGSNGVGSKANPYDEATRVPFLIRWPGRIAAEKVRDHNLGTIDLYPTLCGLAGITPPKECSGQDFSPVMLGKPGPDPTSQFLIVNNFQRNYYRTQLDPAGPNIFYPYRGVRTRRYTYTVYAKGEWFLYDNQQDPYQLKNLVNDPAYAEVKAELRKELDAWLAKAENPYLPAAWLAMSLPDRIAAENRYYSLLPFRKEWDKLKADAVAPHITQAKTDDQRKQLQAAADRVYDEAYFGKYKALDTEIKATKRQTKRTLEDLKAELAAHTAKGAETLKAEAAKVLS
jgi:arylsulfatase A-like enzyme